MINETVIDKQIIFCMNNSATQQLSNSATQCIISAQNTLLI